MYKRQIHWGLYAIPARGEWVRSTEQIPKEDYMKYFEEFNPVDFEPRKWAKAAKEAGMKYMVLTAKHHDGFCLFDSQYTDFKSTNTKCGRDLVAEYVDAVRAEGLKVGLYFSLLDWFHDDFPHYGDRNHPMRNNPAYKNDDRDFDRYLTYMHNQVREICTNYGKLDVLWFDFSYDTLRGEAWKATELINMVRKLQPDVIIALGGGSAMDAGKIMWVMYEHPEVDFQDMAMRFMDIRKRVYTFPKMGEKAYFIAIPTSAGTGSEVTPFAVITDEKTGVKYPLADYELLPKMAIIDTDFHMSAPRGLTAASGIDAVTHALEAYASMMATDYTDGLALKALKTIFEYLPRAYDNGQSDVLAREKMANAATMAGMAFANAFLGVCHSMAHKLGAFHHLPHGVANALMIDEVLRFNAAEVPAKMGTFPQYDHPHTLRRYAEVAEYLGIFGNTDEEKLENLIKAIDGLKERVGIKKTIREYVPDEQDFLNRLDDMVEQAFDDQCTGANPRYPLMSEIKQMYLNAYYGKTFAEKPLPEPVVGVTETVDPRDFKTVYNKKNSK